MATFIIGGIWHGAGWTFVFWGLLHGIALVVQRAWNQLGFKMNSVLAWFITFNFINIAWVFFRAKEWGDAMKVLSSMFTLNIIMLPHFLSTRLSFLQQYGIEFGNWMGEIKGDLYTYIWIFSIFVLILAFKNSTERIKINSVKSTLGLAIFAALLTVLALMKTMHSPYLEFIYFNF